MRPITRIRPTTPVQAMQTYPIGSEHETTVRQAISGQLDGYRRHCTERRAGDGLVEFMFEAGQLCFLVTAHRKKLERPEFYLVRGGDWRANTGLIRRHTRPEHWVEDFAENQERLSRSING
jgi:hypothetical protein